MKKIIFDTDLGVDDAFSLLLICCNEKLKLQAVTLVEGNCKMEYAIENPFKILDFTKDKNVPVYKGAENALKVKRANAEYVHGENGLGNVKYKPIARKIEDKSAVDYLIDEVNKNPKEITIVAIGPLTNIALAIKKNKDFVKNVKELIIMGGSITNGNITPYAEFNFYHDPHAAKIVFDAGFENIIMIGLNVTEKLPLTKNHEKMLLEINSDLSNFLYKATRLGTKYDKKMGLKGLIINDPLTIAYLIDKSLLKLQDAHIAIKIHTKKTGMSYIKENKSPNCKVAIDVDSKKFFQILFSNIFKSNLDIVKKYCD